MLRAMKILMLVGFLAASVPLKSGAKPVKSAQAAPDMQADIQVQAQTQADPWAQILARYLHRGADGLTRVEYASLRASSADMSLLAAYIERQSQARPSTMHRAQAMAYWANLYNALTIHVVAEHYPVASIRQIKSGIRKGPWRRKLVTVEGKTLSLNTIEHDIMRPTFKTPLVHYMINCASIGCPNLKSSPWQAASLDADLEAAARAYINSPRGAHFVDGKLNASKIYKWFKKDFGGTNAGVLSHLKQYANADLRAQLDGHGKIDKYIYDWGVNAP